MTRCLRSFLRNRSGATSIEYGMIALLISVSILLALTLISADLGDMYNSIVAESAG